MRSILLLQSRHNQIPKQSSDEPNIQTQTNQDHWYTGLKSREIEAEEWGILEQTIRNLYCTDGLKLDDVRRLMYTQYGFYATSVSPLLIYVSQILLIDTVGWHNTNTGLIRYGK